MFPNSCKTVFTLAHHFLVLLFLKILTTDFWVEALYHCIIADPLHMFASLPRTLFFFFFFSFPFIGPHPYRGSQARGPIRAVAASLHHSHSNASSEPRLWPTPKGERVTGKQLGGGSCFLGWPGKTSLIRWHLSRDLNQVRDRWGKGMLCKGTSKCEGPEAEIGLVCSRNNKEANVPRRMRMKRRAVEKDTFTEQEGSQILGLWKTYKRTIPGVPPSWRSG